MRLQHRQRAFTLIEVLVAIAIFAIVSALAYGALSQTLTSSEILGARMDRLLAIQRTMQQLDQDFMQLAPRPVRKDLGDNHAPALQSELLSGVAIEMTRAGWNNPTAMPRGTLQRVAYVLEDDELLRYYWQVLDRTYSNEPVIVTLLDDVESLQVRYMSTSGEWADSWPAETVGAAPDLRGRPRAVEIILRLAGEGEIRRLVEVAP